MDWHGIVSKAIEAFRDTSGLESYAMDAAAKAASKEYERQRAEESDCAVIDLGLLQQIRKLHSESAMMIWYDGSAVVAEDAGKPVGMESKWLCHWDAGDDPNAAMQEYLDAQKPAWHWPEPELPIPEEGVRAWVRDWSNERKWLRRLVLASVKGWWVCETEGDSRRPICMPYAVLPDPANPDQPPPADWTPN